MAEEAQEELTSRDEKLKVLVAMGMSEERARFILAVEFGDIPGDVIEDEPDEPSEG